MSAVGTAPSLHTAVSSSAEVRTLAEVPGHLAVRAGVVLRVKEMIIPGQCLFPACPGQAGHTVTLTLGEGREPLGLSRMNPH